MESLHTKWRPRELTEVVGQDHVVDAFLGLKKDAPPHAYLFSGPAGVGKTTFARLVGEVLVEGDVELREYDAATHSKVEQMRDLLSAIDYRPMGGGSILIIVDECHGLSKQAWDAFLKKLEEPPAHVYFALCTTNLAKVPKTIQTRCHAFVLEEVRANAITVLLEEVVKEEDISLDDECLALIARHAAGSPRQALVSLSLCAHAQDKTEVAALLKSAEGSDEVIDLCRYLLKREGDLDGALVLLKNIESDAEGIRLVVCAYMTTTVLGGGRGGYNPRGLDLLLAFRHPCNPAEGKAPIILSLADFYLR